VDVFTDLDKVVDAFNTQDDVLFQFSGALGEVTGTFCTTDFVAFQAGYKVGKSWWLMHTALTAMMHDRRVLFITMEMPVNQVIKRMWRCIKGSPKRDKTVLVPIFVPSDSSSDECPIYHIERVPTEMTGIDATLETFTEWRGTYAKYFRKGGIKVVRLPKKSTLRDVDALLAHYEYYDNWAPEVVVIDYADHLSSPIKGELRHQLDDIWSGMRDEALNRMQCWVTATQTNAEGLKGNLSQSSVAEHKGKVGHVTKMIDVMSGKLEKVQNVYYVSCETDREEESSYEQAVVLHCLDIGAVALASQYKRQVEVEG
jgi:hypothetical protein